jgi:hypothetical protein
MLVAEGLLSETTLSRALHVQRNAEQKMRFGTVLLERDLLGEEALLSALARQYRCEPVTWKMLSLAPSKIVTLLPERAATRLGAMPYALSGGRLLVAFLDPSNIAAVDEVSAITGKPVRAAVTTELRLLQAHNRFYGRRLPVQLHVAVQKIERREAARATSSARPVPARPTTPPPPPNPFAAPPEEIREAPRVEYTFDSLANPATARVAEPVVDFGAPVETAVPVPVVPEPPPALEVDEPAGHDEETVESLSEWMEQAIGSLWGEPSSPPIDAETPIAEPGGTGGGGALWVEERQADTTAAAVASGLWNEVALPATSDPDGIAIESVLPEFPRVLLLVLGRTSISGWKGRGRGVPNDAMHRLRIPRDQKDVFFLVEASGAPHYGPLEHGLWPKPLAELFGGGPPECAVFPIRADGHVEGFLYADRLGSPMPYEAFPAAARAASAVASPLSRYLRRRRATAL